AKQTSGSHAKRASCLNDYRPLVTLGLEKSPQGRLSLIAPFDPPELHMVCVLDRGDNRGILMWCKIIPSLVGTHEGPDAFPRIFAGCVWALTLRSHHATPPDTLGEDRCDRIEFRSSQPA